MATAQSLTSAVFDGQEITADFVGGRVQIRGYGPLVHRMYEERDVPFWTELGLLESHTDWKPTWGSLAEDLVAKTDEAQCLIAVNLPALGSIHRGLALGEQVRVFNSQETAPELLRLLAKLSGDDLRTPSLRELATTLSAFQGGKG